MNEVFVPGSEEKKEAKPVAESEGKNDRDSKVIKEAIDKAAKEQNKDAKQDLWNRKNIYLSFLFYAFFICDNMLLSY